MGMDTMQTRLEYLDQRHKALNEDMNALGRSDPYGYEDAVREYTIIARERTWLHKVNSLLTPPHTFGPYEEELFRIHTSILFYPYTVLTPFNIPRFEALDMVTLPRSATLNTITLPSIRMSFSYETHLGNFPPARYLADQILHQYVHQQPELESYVRAVEIANRNLEYAYKMGNDRMLFIAPSDSPYLDLARQLFHYALDHRATRID